MACHVDVERSENVSGGIADMNADGKSDDFIVLSTRANKVAAAEAESVEERESPHTAPPLGQTITNHGFATSRDGQAA